MEQLTSRGTFETSAVKIVFPHQVMNEKLMLVLIIVGCTSLVFLICFPIDFYLYRRRKRLAREHHIATCRSQRTPQRAAQCHANMAVTNISAEIDFNEINEIEQRKYRAKRGVIRFLSMLKKKSSAETLDFQERSAQTTLSEGSSDLPVKSSMEPEMEIADNLGNVYPETNELVHINACSEAKSIHRNSYDDDYLEYSPRKKFSNVTKETNENQEFINYTKKRSHLVVRYNKKISQNGTSCKKKKSHNRVHHEKKKPRLRALEPLENTTNVLGEINDKYCFTIPFRSGNEDHWQPVNIDDESYKDVVHDKSHRNRHILKSSATTLTGEETDAVITSDNRNGGFIVEKTSKDNQRDRTLLFQTDLNTEENRCRNHNILTHSQSEQCLSRNYSQSKRSHWNGRNIVSPVSDNKIHFSDMGNSSKNNIKLISVPILSEFPAIPKVKRKKKRNPFLKKQCSDSMPELHWEKY